MNFLLALDSYKNCLDSRSVSECVASGIREILPDAVTDILPVADGGEGSVQAVAANNPGAEIRHDEAQGPLGELHQAEYAWFPQEKTAFLELADICGIEQLPDHRLDIMHASTFGLGTMIRKLHHQGIRNFIIAIGGSASCDGGLGLLQALGAEFLNKKGQLVPSLAGPAILPQISSCNLNRVLQLGGSISLRIFSDVTNPLLGSLGSAAVFGPQKGAAPEDIPVLENSLKHFYEILKQQIPELRCDCPGDGAAGGTGFALRGVLGGTTVSGADSILRLAHFQERLNQADWVITGEGQSDSQTLQGKLPGVIADQAEQLHKPCILLSGAVKETRSLQQKFTAVFSIAQGPGSLQQALDNTRTNLKIYGRNIAAMIKNSLTL